MPIGGIVIRVKPGQAQIVARRLRELPDVEVASITDQGLALVLAADTVKAQKLRHDDISGWPEVEEARVVFQSSEV